MENSAFNDASSALVVIDVQNDFCPGGALAVAGGDEIIPEINQLSLKFANVILTQDWHPNNHSSFASNHEGKNPFETIEMEYGIQVLWPKHCVQGSTGADFHSDLNTEAAQLVVRKGFRNKVDSYSAFFENDQATSTGLAGYLKARNINNLLFVGLATDYCVAWSALDAVKLGFKTSVNLSACRAIDLDGSLEYQIEEMRCAGVTLTE